MAFAVQTITAETSLCTFLTKWRRGNLNRPRSGRIPTLGKIPSEATRGDRQPLQSLARPATSAELYILP